MRVVIYPREPTTWPQCGTYAGKSAHYYHGERACAACQAAANAYLAAYRRYGRCAPGLGWPLGPNDPAPRTRTKAAPKWARETGARA